MRLPEIVAVHEFGHQYWYGMVANDEVNEAWLDEGINSYVEGLIMDDTYGADRSYFDLLGLGSRRRPACSVSAISLPATGIRSTSRRSRMLDRDSYRSTTYAKAALALHTIDRTLGGDRLRDALREYFARWRFRHPTSRDFRRA